MDMESDEEPELCGVAIRQVVGRSVTAGTNAVYISNDEYMLARFIYVGCSLCMI